MDATESLMIRVAARSDGIDVAACRHLLRQNKIPHRLVRSGLDLIVEVPREYSSAAILLVLERQSTISFKQRPRIDDVLMAIITGAMIGAILAPLLVFMIVWALALSTVICLLVAVISIPIGIVVGGYFGYSRYFDVAR